MHHNLDGEHLLVVLLQQVYGIFRYTVLCAAKEERACVNSPRNTSWNYANVRLVWT